MFFTTAGFNFIDELGFDDLSRVQWLGYSDAIYGEGVWNAMLKNNSYIYAGLPNFDWKHQEAKYITSYSQILDSYDNKKYRQWLRKMAENSNFKNESALLRVRPDTFIAREYHYSNIEKVKISYVKNRSLL